MGVLAENPPGETIDPSPELDSTEHYEHRIDYV
jgi:hypothetical protein